MGHDLYLTAKLSSRVFDFGDWKQSRCGLFRDFAEKFESDAIKSVRDGTYGEAEYWRPSNFAEVRKWLTEQSSRDTSIFEEFKDLATAVVLMEFDESLWFHSSW